MTDPRVKQLTLLGVAFLSLAYAVPSVSRPVVRARRLETIGIRKVNMIPKQPMPILRQPKAAQAAAK